MPDTTPRSAHEYYREPLESLFWQNNPDNQVVQLNNLDLHPLKWSN